MTDVRAGKLFSVGNYVGEEDLTGQITGSNDTFTTANNYTAGTIRVFLNGLRQQKGTGKDYIEVGPNQIQFSMMPEIDDILLVDYIKN